MNTQFVNGYALLIGVNESQEKRLALPDVLKDVKALEKVLVHPERCSFLQDNVKSLTGAQATRMGILGGLTWLKQCLSKDTSGNATVLVYYTGHGWRDESVTPPDHYLIPFDVSESMMSMSAIRANEFSTAISALQPRRLLVILDCCHAGGMGVKDTEPTSGFKSIGLSPELFMMGQAGVSASKGIGELMTLQTGTGRAVLSSSQGEQSSWMRRDGTMSIFTYHLIEALTGHAQPEGGANEVLVSDVMSYVWRHVPESTKREWDAEQQPDYQVSGNFPVALLLGGKGLSRGQKAPDPLEISRGEPESPRPHIDTDGGAYIAGEVHVEGGDFVGRDQIVHGDQIRVGNVSGQGIAIGQGARAEVNEGDTFNMSGDFRGAILNIKSTLDNVVQTIGTMPNADNTTKAELEKLIKQLDEHLKQVPPEKVEEAQAIATQTQWLVQEAAKEKPNKPLLQITGESLKKAAGNIAAVMPVVLDIVKLIFTTVAKITT